MAQIALKMSPMRPWLEKFLNISTLKWLKLHLNCPPWLEKFLNITTLKWLKLHLNCPPWLEKFLNITSLKWLKLHLNCPPWLEFEDFQIFQTSNSRFYRIIGLFSRIWSNFFKIPGFSRGWNIIPGFSRFFQVFPGSGHPVVWVIRITKTMGPLLAVERFPE